MRSLSFSGVRVPDVRASQRQSFAGRISHRVASGLSFANPSFREARSGTIIGTTINTLCSVIGAGVLSLPLALYYSSVLVGLGLLLFLSVFAAFSVYLLVVGCDATGRYSLTEVVAFALYPPQLWEEYLYQRGAERSAQLASSFEGGSPRALDTEAQTSALRDGSADGTGDEASTTTAEAPDAKRRHRRSRRLRQSAYSLSPSGSAADNEDHFGSPRTSAYAGLRDAYARQEWHRRRCRRVVTVLMEFVVFCSNYGTLVIYSKVIADSMPPVVSYITHTDGVLVSKYFWLAAGGVVFFVLSCARNMEELKWSSLLGFLTIFYIVLLILFRYHTQRVRDYPHVDPRDYGSIQWVHFSAKMLQTVSTFGLAFSYHYNVPYFYKELRDRRPRRMMESIAVAFPIIICCYALTGVFGYLTFGDEVASKKVGGNIVSNYPKNDVLMNVGRLGLFAHFACVFPVVSICTRRGLHRLTMIGLTWAEQSALMREAAAASGAVLTDAEAGRSNSTAFATASTTTTTATQRLREGESGAGREKAASGDAVAAVVPGEASPLLLHPGGSAPPPPGYEVFSSSSPQQQHPAGSFAAAGAGGTGSPAMLTTPPLHPTITATAAAAAAGPAYHSFSSSTNAAEEEEQAELMQGGPPGTVDVDRDVGSPDLTTTLAIVLEAAFLVCTTVLIAGTVSGIDFVIHVVGTLFSVFIVMVAPGMVGWCVFSPNGPFGSATAAAAAYLTLQQGGGEEGDGAGDVRSSDVAVNGAASRYRFIRLKQAMCVVNAVLGVCITCVGISVLVYDTAKGHYKPSL
ncbi:transmembrane amino acid transporter protein-like protein [Lotmaria passim]